ncbi:proton-activated chloride channel isoform X3 [Corythoichthys intestinalis]|uniref:proton-activated chloride channel isoform X3 n=1 Tax=Corythoichthys intestinalis TaxID=161448 RepID=UPI0025A5543A|nr:proton-activated chloride channel isoform X3 [Corythoichthys intestinalis]
MVVARKKKGGAEKVREKKLKKLQSEASKCHKLTHVRKQQSGSKATPASNSPAPGDDESGSSSGSHVQPVQGETTNEGEANDELVEVPQTSAGQFNDDEDHNEEMQSPDFFHDVEDDSEERNESILPEVPNLFKSQPVSAMRLRNKDETRGSTPSMRVSKACLKNVFTVVLIFIYLLLTAVAAFLAYQTISDFLEKVNHPVMSVTYKEVDAFLPPGIALYPGNARLLSCRHHLHDDIPPLVNPGKPQEGDCIIKEVTYDGPFTNRTQKKALVVQGPSDVRNKELIFMQFSQNETEEDFSAITYMPFANFSDLEHSLNKSKFMRDCERNYSTWTFSGGFRTWVKMSLVRTSGKSDQSSTVVKFNDKRPEPERSNQLFFVVFEWRDPFIQEIQLIVTANPWSSAAILCGVFMALFKAANFAKLTVQWIIRMRKRHLRNKARQLSTIN